MPKRAPSPTDIRRNVTRKSQDVMRGVLDELGVSDPSTRKQPPRKPPVRASAIRKRPGSR
jgi:hypothetical protein